MRNNLLRDCLVLNSEYLLFTERDIALEITLEITESGQKERQSRDETGHKMIKLSQPGQQRKLAPKPRTDSTLSELKSSPLTSLLHLQTSCINSRDQWAKQELHRHLVVHPPASLHRKCFGQKPLHA